ncbi:hypothetical protein [Achromobacter spanius]|uniref:hypothetical protein n=1 Tax=Achromobacter spanius TaxID=217203 RepID=UPI0012EDCA24|nr:hypothetical protein [Achromobacter spanius]
MAFLLMELDRRPIKVKGEAILPGIAIPGGAEDFRPGEYIGVNSGVVVELVNVGGKILPEEPARFAFSVCGPTPVSLRVDRIHRDTLLTDVLVKNKSELVVAECEFSRNSLPHELEGYWLPTVFFRGETRIGTGWILQTAGRIVCRLVHQRGVEVRGKILAKLLNLKGVFFEFEMVD